MMRADPPTTGSAERDLLSRVRQRCEEVAAIATSVAIVEDRVVGYAEQLADLSAEPDPGDPAHHDVAQDDETLCLFVLALDAVNFGSGWFPVLRKAQGKSGYHTIAGGLADHVRSRGLTTADLGSIDASAMASITGQDVDGPVRPLLDQFVESWHLLGTCIDETSGGSALTFVSGADRSAARLAEMLDARHRLYRDAPNYAGSPVPLYKRAQITAADLHHAFDGRGPGAFDDLDRLTMFADNLVPHVLRLDGLLSFDPALVERIDAGELLTAGEPAEVEIRAVAVHAVELLVTEMRSAGHVVNAMTLDGLLWHRGADALYKSRPRHRCRTTAY